ncbi:MAG TPA: hypothetical protein VN830_09495, partial [Verrucomicrobiae bacterium]|nr:hypothetical protein [Verrucomicrobiae bacterium]
MLRQKTPAKSQQKRLIYENFLVWCYWGAIRFRDYGVQGRHYGVELGWPKMGITEGHCEPPVPEQFCDIGQGGALL